MGAEVPSAVRATLDPRQTRRTQAHDTPSRGLSQPAGANDVALRPAPLGAGQCRAVRGQPCHGPHHCLTNEMPLVQIAEHCYPDRPLVG